jgi:co-chaperonin GroES (HSP10)
MSDVIPVAIGWKVVVRPLDGKTTSKGGVDISATVDAQEHLNYIGEVVAIGEAAFKSRTQGGLDMSAWQAVPQIGDYVLYPPYAGMKISRAGERKPLRLMNDTDIVALIGNPDDYYSWVDA